MSSWISFEGRVVVMEWGDCLYTVLPLPEEVSSVLHAEKVKHVEIELNDHKFNMALTKAPVIAATFVYTGKSVLREAMISVDEPIDVRLRRADPDQVDVPEDVFLAIRQGEMTEAWEALSPGRKRSLLHEVGTARRAETRARRIGKLVRGLAE